MERRRAERGNDRRLLGDLLIEAGLVSRSGLLAGLEEQQLRGGRLGYTLLKIGRVTPAALYLFLQDTLPALSPDLVDTLRSAPAVDLIPARLAHHYGMVPVRVQDGILDLAIATADSPRLIPAVEELTGLRVDPLICPPSLIAEALARSYPCEVEAGVIHPPAGDCLFVLSDRRRGIRPLLPETIREDAPASEWLRAIAAEGIRRAARRIQIEPGPGEMRVAFHGPLGDADEIDLPRGAYAGLSGLLSGLSGIAARGRVVPCEGRLTLTVDGRRISASVLAMPGFDDQIYTLGLRDQRVAPAERPDLEADLPDLPPVLARMAQEGRGLLLLAGPGAAEAEVGLAAVLDLLGNRLPRRIVLGETAPHASLEVVSVPADEERVPLEPLLVRTLARAPDLLVLPEPSGAIDLAAAFALADERVVLAPFAAVDAFDAAERLARAGAHRSPSSEGRLVGILGVRLMEQLCRSCARPYDLYELLAPWPRHRRPLPGSYFAGQGCASCRGSGAQRLEPVFEFLPLLPGEIPLQSGGLAGVLRERRAVQGSPTLFQSALRRAAAGSLDVREPLRLLLHEQR